MALDVAVSMAGEAQELGGRRPVDQFAGLLRRQLDGGMVLDRLAVVPVRYNHSQILRSQPGTRSGLGR